MEAVAARKEGSLKIEVRPLPKSVVERLNIKLWRLSQFGKNWHKQTNNKIATVIFIKRIFISQCLAKIKPATKVRTKTVSFIKSIGLANKKVVRIEKMNTAKTILDFVSSITVLMLINTAKNNITRLIGEISNPKVKFALFVITANKNRIKVPIFIGLCF